MNGTISVFLQNGGEGVWLALPASRDDFLNALREIKAANYNSITIGQYKTAVAALPVELLKSADLDQANYLASRLAELSSEHAELLEAMLESPLQSKVLNDIKKLIDYFDNTGAYEVYSGVNSPVDLAQYYIEESGLIEIPPEWAEGIDLERFGKNLEKHELGYYTRHGYLIGTGLAWKPVFEICSEVPYEYRIAPEK